MKHLNLMLAGMLLCAVANAQTDTTYLDLGRMRARKEFTQTTIIKASDLAQMPFTNLSDVIRLWVNGSYTDKVTIAYIIDGVMLNDADAYSIYDIEEITIVQNALSQPNGAGNLQMLALIKTKRSKGTGPHFSFAGQAFAVSKKDKESKYTTNVFHQYNLSGSGNIGTVYVGGTVNYLHDAMPANKRDDLKVTTTPNIDRFRAHLWIETDLGKKNKISIQGNYTPQVCHADSTSLFSSGSISHLAKFNESLINTTLQLQTTFTRSLLNKFSAGYTTNNQVGKDTVVSKFVQNPNIPSNIQSGYKADLKGYVLFLNDNINYTWNFRNWSVEPSLSINFQSMKYDRDNYYWSLNNGLASASGQMQYAKGNVLTVMPSIAVSYKNIINAQGGFLQDISKIVQKDVHEAKAYPFVSIGANILSANKLSWKVFGSYAKTFPLNSFSLFQLNDFSNYQGYFNSISERLYFVPLPGIFNFGAPSSYNNKWQAGSDFSFFHKRITLGYNYLNASDLMFAFTTIPWWEIGSPINRFPIKYTMERHQVKIVGDVIQNETFKWHTGLFVNFFNNKSNLGNRKLQVDEKNNSGGWTNRLAYKSFSLGADMLYLFNKEVTPGLYKTEKHNSILLQNVYLAYTINSKKLHNLNVYISSRNFADSNTMPLASDNRRFYGGGVKFDF